MEPTAVPEVVLYRDDILWVLLEGEKNPIAPSYPLRDQEVPVSRAQIFKKIAELTPFSSLDQKVFEGLFSHADGWQQARVAFLDKFQEAPLESNLDPEKLRELKADKKATVKRQDTWKKVANLGNEPTEITKMAADNVVKEELNRPAEEFLAIAGPIKETRNVVTQNTVESSPVSSNKARDFIQNAKQNRMETIGFRDWLRNPIGTFKKWWGGRENASGVINKLNGVGQVNVLSGVGEKNVFKITSAGDSAIQTIAGSSWRANLKIFLSNPVKAIGGFFKSNRDKTSIVAQGAKNVAKKGTKAVASEMGKKSWGMMLKKGATALLAKLGIGAATGGVGAVALAVVDVAKKILNSEKLKNLASKLMIAASVGIYFLWTNLTGLIMGSAGAFLAAPFGATAMATGFGAGFALGWGLQNIAASFFGGGGGATFTAGGASSGGAAAGGVSSASSISIAGMTFNVSGLTSAASSFGAMLTGSGIPTIVFFGIGGGIGALILSVTITLAAVLQTPEQQTDANYEGPQNILTVKSTVVPEKLNNDSGALVTYSIIVTSSSDKDANLSFSINEVLQNKNGNTGIEKPDPKKTLPSKIGAGETLDIPFNSYAVKNEYNDSDLVFTVRVTTGTESQTASSLTRIGSPPVNNDQPFGYPASGNIVRFEDDPSHNGTFFNSSGGRYWVAGGMDIVNHGNNPPVYSTVNGSVIFSSFDYGDSARTATSCSSPIAVVAPFHYCAVGGAVIVKSGNYIVSYLHLQSSPLASGEIHKGDTIGYMYPEALPTSDAPHVHYQVLLNGANVPFGSSANGSTAPCTPQKILPEIATRKSVTQDGSGPFVCQ